MEVLDTVMVMELSLVESPKEALVTWVSLADTLPTIVTTKTAPAVPVVDTKRVTVVGTVVAVVETSIRTSTILLVDMASNLTIWVTTWITLAAGHMVVWIRTAV
jgi:hypothetical protein